MLLLVFNLISIIFPILRIYLIPCASFIIQVVIGFLVLYSSCGHTTNMNVKLVVIARVEDLRGMLDWSVNYELKQHCNYWKIDMH